MPAMHPDDLLAQLKAWRDSQDPRDQDAFQYVTEFLNEAQPGQTVAPSGPAGYQDPSMAAQDAEYRKQEEEAKLYRGHSALFPADQMQVSGTKGIGPMGRPEDSPAVANEIASFKGEVKKSQHQDALAALLEKYKQKKMASAQ